MGKPVILRTVLRDSFLHTFRHGNFVVKRNDLLGTLNDPRQNAFTSVLVKVLTIVFDVAVAFNLGIEGYDNQPAPDTVIGGADLREMVRVEHQRMPSA